MGVTSAGSYSLLINTSLCTTQKFDIFCNAGVTLVIDNISMVEYEPSVAELWAYPGPSGVGFPGASSSDAYANTWYDQSGSGNNATQATAAAQPLLIRAGVTNTENGKPALSFDGVDDELSADANVFATSAYPNTKVCVYNSASVSTGVVSLSKDGDAATYSTLLQTNSTRANNTSRGLSGTSSVLGVANTDEQHIAFGFDASATDHNISVDGAAVVSDSTDTGEVAGVDKFLIGNWRNPSPAYHEGKIQEIIIYASDQSANRTILETNINDHYGIY